MQNNGIYQRDPDCRPDSEFERGSLHHLVVGNEGRLLDPRRTPIRIVALRPEAGFFHAEIAGFEDKGAVWEVPFEEVRLYQFAKDSAMADATSVSEMAAIVAKLDRELIIACGANDARTALAKSSEARRRAARWIDADPLIVDVIPSTPAGEIGRTRPLRRSFVLYMDDLGLGEIERAFAERFVSNPYSGDLVKGHRIVLAELGVVSYEDKAPRDPDIFDGEWSRERRAEHILARLAFLRELWDRAGVESVTLYRGMTVSERLDPPRNRTFISATFKREVALSHFDSDIGNSMGVLYRQEISIDRLFMTFLETDAMNNRFREYEAVLFFDPDNPVF
jgi:hypothetical protein